MRQEIITYFKTLHNKTGGHCGASLATVCYDVKYPYRSVKKVLNNLYADGIITIHKGKDGTIAKYKPT